jgi:hypothetical protein
MKYLTNDGYILLDKKGNAYLGFYANEILKIFIQNKIDDFKSQQEILDYAVTQNKLIKT